MLKLKIHSPHWNIITTSGLNHLIFLKIMWLYASINQLFILSILK